MFAFPPHGAINQVDGNAPTLCILYTYIYLHIHIYACLEQRNSFGHEWLWKSLVGKKVQEVD